MSRSAHDTRRTAHAATADAVEKTASPEAGGSEPPQAESCSKDEHLTAGSDPNNPPPPSVPGLEEAAAVFDFRSPVFGLRRAARAELARRNFADFAAQVHPRIEMTPFHRTYYQVLEAFARGEIRKLIVSMPPQHGKSLGSSVLLPAWLLGRDPELRVAVACYNAKLAARFNRQIRHVLSSDPYAAAFPRSAIERGKKTAAGYTRSDEQIDIPGHAGGTFAVGREGTLTGNAVDIFILDDLYKDAMEAHSPLVRENCWEWYTSVVRTRLHNRSQELIVFTRWHEEDLIGRIAASEAVIPLEEWDHGARYTAHGARGGLFEAENNFPYSASPEAAACAASRSPCTDDAWLHLNFEAIKESPPSALDPRAAGEPLWPQKHSLKLLEEKKNLDPQRFAALYQGHPASGEGYLYGEGFALYDTLPEDIVALGSYTDPADTGDDYLCSLCYAADAAGRIYLTDAVYSRAPMEVTEGLVVEMLRRGGTRQAFVEANNGGRGFARAVAAALPEVRVETFAQSANKQARILSLAPSVLQRVVVPRDWHRRWPELRAHLCTYRRAFHKNRWHDAADALTGVVERQGAPGAKGIRALKFKR